MKKTCDAPVVAKINGQVIPLSLHCTEERGHKGEHGLYVSWPEAEKVGIVLDVTVEPK